MHDQRPLTVVQVLSRFDDGSAAQGALDIAAELVRRGHRAIVISPPGRLVPFLHAKGGEHVAWPLDRGLFAGRWVRRLRRLLQAERVHVLHAWSYRPARIVYQAWQSLPPEHRPRFVTTAHDFEPFAPRNEPVARGERVIAPSAAVRRHLLETYPQMDEGNVCVIYRGLDERAFPYGYKPDIHWLQEWYRRHPQLLDRYTVTLPARLGPGMGHYEFIELMGRLRAEGIEACGLIVGEDDPRAGGYAKALRRLIHDKPTDNVVLIDAGQDMRNILSVSNLVVSLAARPQAFGSIVLKALQLGVPVVGYDHGAVGEALGRVFPDGRTPVSDMESMTRRVMDLLRRPLQVEHPPFGLRHMLDETIDVYRQLAGAGPSGPETVEG